MSFIDRRIRPKAAEALLVRLLTLRHRCPECDHLDVSELAAGESKNVNALMDDAQYERLRKAAFETRRAMTDILREALDEWLARFEAPRGG